jgi:hypothetical protein
MRERLQSITTISTAPPPSSMPIAYPSASCPTMHTATQPLKLKDFIKRQAPDESLELFADRCKRGIANLEVQPPLKVVIDQIHCLMNEATDALFSGLLFSKEPIASLEDLFNKLRLRLPTTSSHVEPRQKPGQSVAAFADNCRAFIYGRHRNIDATAQESFAIQIFIAGLSSDSVRREVRRLNNTHEFANNSPAPFRELINAAAAAEQAETAETDQKSRTFGSVRSLQAQPPTSRIMSPIPPRIARPISRLTTGENISQFKYFRSVPTGSCWRCGKPGHSFKDQCCPLYPKTSVAASLN